MPKNYWIMLKRRDATEDLGSEERVMSKWILGKWGWKKWIGLIWPRAGTSGWVFVINLRVPWKTLNFLTGRTCYWLLKKESALWSQLIS
jgi:hypothetical protein